MPEAYLAAQLYTLRNAEMDFERVMAAVAEAGFDGVETVGTHGLTAPALRSAIADHGLTGCSSHVQLAQLENDFDATVDYYQEAGIMTLVVPFLTPAERPGDALGWKALGERLEHLAQRCSDEGIALLYHNHGFEFEPVEDRTGLWFMLSASATLGVELDIGWAVRSGVDPLELLARHEGRVPRVHVKDLAAHGAEEEGGWADVGHGTVTWPPLLRAARAAGTDWYVVEHDHPRNPVASIRRSAAYLRVALASL